MGLTKSLYRNNRYNDYYIDYNPVQLPANETPVRKSTAPYNPVRLPIDETPARKSTVPYNPVRLPIDDPKISKDTKNEATLQDARMFEKLLIEDLLRNQQ